MSAPVDDMADSTDFFVIAEAWAAGLITTDDAVGRVRVAASDSGHVPLAPWSGGAVEPVRPDHRRWSPFDHDDIPDRRRR